MFRQDHKLLITKSSVWQVPRCGVEWCQSLGYGASVPEYSRKRQAADRETGVPGRAGAAHPTVPALLHSDCMEGRHVLGYTHLIATNSWVSWLFTTANYLNVYDYKRTLYFIFHLYNKETHVRSVNCTVVYSMLLIVRRL